jgi:hypothetical protein
MALKIVLTLKERIVTAHTQTVGGKAVEELTTDNKVNDD